MKVAVAQEVVEAWQESHWAVVATWVDGFVWAFCEMKPPLWQVMHFPAMPAWFIVAGDQLANPLTWQVSHAAEVGMWMVGLPSALAKVKLPLWQVAHCPSVPPWFIWAGLKAM